MEHPSCSFDEFANRRPVIQVHARQLHRKACHGGTGLVAAHGHVKVIKSECCQTRDQRGADEACAASDHGLSKWKAGPVRPRGRLPGGLPRGVGVLNQPHRRGSLAGRHNARGITSECT